MIRSVFWRPLDEIGLEHLWFERTPDWLRDQMVRQQFETEVQFGPATVPAGIVEIARQRPKHVVLQDVTMQRLTCRRLLGDDRKATSGIRIVRLLTSLPGKSGRSFLNETPRRKNSATAKGI